jgi:hypothetical protein
VRAFFVIPSRAQRVSHRHASTPRAANTDTHHPHRTTRIASIIVSVVDE